jgi:hypothetical protein
MRFLLALAAALACASAFAATTYSTDASDLWWNPDESGWGVNVEQQGDTVFLTLFVYGADSKPTWYVASALQGTKTATTLSFAGDLFATTGPVFSGTFDPNAVTVTKVGTATFQLTDSANATFTYTVNGTRVQKLVTRQTWRVNDATGTYIGYLGTSCAASTNTGEESMTFTISMLPTFNLATTTNFTSCGYSGTYAQAGRLGHVDGNFNCANGRSGTFTLDGIEASPDAVMGRLTTRTSNCNLSGRLAGIRRN